MSNVVRTVCLVALAAMLGACDADSPTEPTQTPNAPLPTSATTGFAISVGVSPNSVVLGEGTTVQVTVVARRTDTNELMTRGSTAVLSTTNGTLTNEAGNSVGTTVNLVFGLNGTALATLTGVVEEAVVRAQIEQSTGQATVRVNEAPTVTPFSLIQASPNFGPPAGGTEVRIEGTGFSLPTEVVFGGIAVPVLSVSSSVIRVRSPQIELASGQNRTVSISVSVNVGEELAASGTLSGGFTYTRNPSPTIPKIISVTPTSGPNEGGTRVTIFGEAFGSEVQVFFGSSSLVEATVLDLTPSRILVVTPSATGPNSGVQNSVVTVRVRDLRSGFEASLAGAFQYGGGDMEITAISPGEGFYLGGTLVTIFGTGGFEAPVAVTFGGAAQQVVSVSGTEIVARAVPVEVGCGGRSGASSVVNIETGQQFLNGPSFTYRTAAPALDSVSPESFTVDVDTGVVSGGPLTVFGSGFDRQSDPPGATIDGVSSPLVRVTSIDPNPLYAGHGIGDRLSVDLPVYQGSFGTESCMIGGETGERFAATDVIVAVTSNCGTDSRTVSGTITYLPSDTTCRAQPVAAFAPGGFDFDAATNTLTILDGSTNADSVEVDFGDLTATETGPPGSMFVHLYMEAGTFTVKLTAFNDQGSASITRVVTVVIPEVPIASFTATINGLTVTVTDASLNSPDVLEWDFDDPTSPETGVPGESRAHTFAIPGIYDIKLTATNSAGSDSTTNTVFVTGP